MDQIGPNWGQIGPKQPILKVETRDFTNSTDLKISTTVSAYIKLLDPTPATKWVNWTKLGQIWAKLDRSTYFDQRDLHFWHRFKPEVLALSELF